MQRLQTLTLVLGLAGGLSHYTGHASAQVTPTPATSSPVATAQATTVRTPSSQELQLLGALRANPATAAFPFTTEPRGSKILLRGRVGGRVTHDVAIRTAIALGVPVEDGIVIDTAFGMGGMGMGMGMGFGPVPGPGPTTTGGYGFGGPPAFGNGGGFNGSAVGGYNAGFGGPATGGLPLAAAFPSAGSYGGAPSLLPPPLFGRYDDPFYGFDPPAVAYPPWWGYLNAQRQVSNAAFAQANPAPNANGFAAPGAGSLGMANGGAIGATGQPLGTDGAVPEGMTATDVGLIPDGTIDMAIDGLGIATLRGAVPSQAERTAIGQRVAATPGVAQVVNLLTIKPSLASRVVSANPNANPAANNNPPPPPVPAGAPAANRPAAIVSAPMATANANGNGNAAPASPTPAPDPASDAGLADRASRALADRAALLTSPVRVKVSNGVATITGKVPTAYEAMLAYRSVQQTPGIRGIDDRLEFIVPSGEGSNPLIDRGRPDDVEPYLEAQIRRQVGDFAHVDRVRLQADVLDIRGSLSRAEDRDRFDAILRSLPLLRGFQVRTDMPVATP